MADQSKEENKPAIVHDSSVANREVKAAPPQTDMVSLQKVQSDVVKYVSNMLGEERAAEFATNAALISQGNKALKDAIEKNPDSFLTAYLASASLDLMPNTPEQLAYLIPYGNVVQFQVGYKGLLKLARRSGEILTISAELVFQGDDFDVLYGSERSIHHVPDLDIDRTNYGLVTRAYAVAKLKNGETQFAVMTRAELDKIQKTVKSSSTDSPWKAWPERQAIKTVLKRLTQLLPSSTDDALQRAVQLDSLAEAGKLKMDRSGNIIEGELVDEVSQKTKSEIAAAANRTELMAILSALPIKLRKAATGLVNERIAEIAAAKKASATEGEATTEE